MESNSYIESRAGKQLKPKCWQMKVWESPWILKNMNLKVWNFFHRTNNRDNKTRIGPFAVQTAVDPGRTVVWPW